MSELALLSSDEVEIARWNPKTSSISQLRGLLQGRVVHVEWIRSLGETAELVTATAEQVLSWINRDSRLESKDLKRLLQRRIDWTPDGKTTEQPMPIREVLTQWMQSSEFRDTFFAKRKAAEPTPLDWYVQDEPSRIELESWPQLLSSHVMLRPKCDRALGDLISIACRVEAPTHLKDWVLQVAPRLPAFSQSALTLANCHERLWSFQLIPFGNGFSSSLVAHAEWASQLGSMSIYAPSSHICWTRRILSVLVSHGAGIHSDFQIAPDPELAARIVSPCWGRGVEEPERILGSEEQPIVLLYSVTHDLPKALSQEPFDFQGWDAVMRVVPRDFGFRVSSLLSDWFEASREQLLARDLPTHRRGRWAVKWWKHFGGPTPEQNERLADLLEKMKANPSGGLRT